MSTQAKTQESSFPWKLSTFVLLAAGAYLLSPARSTFPKFFRKWLQSELTKVGGFASEYQTVGMFSCGWGSMFYSALLCGHGFMGAVMLFFLGE